MARTYTLEELELARAVLEWARTPGPHGGNPYLLGFVQLAEKIIEESDLAEAEHGLALEIETGRPY